MELRSLDSGRVLLHTFACPIVTRLVLYLCIHGWMIVNVSPLRHQVLSTLWWLAWWGICICGGKATEPAASVNQEATKAKDLLLRRIFSYNLSLVSIATVVKAYWITDRTRSFE